MAKVKYDVSDAEQRTFEVPKPGVYEAAIREMSHGNSNNGNPMLTLVFELTKGDHKGSRIWHYILTDGSQDWRLREFTDAVGLKPKGTIDTDALQGTVVQLRTAVDPARDGYDEKARVKNVMPAKNGASADGDDEEDEPYEEWSTEDLREEAEARELEVEGKKTRKRLISALEADDEEGDDEEEEEEGTEEEGEEEGEEEDEEDDEDEEEDDEDEESLSMSDIKGMSRTELKSLIKEEELEVRVTKKTSDDDLRQKVAEALEIEADEDSKDDEEEEDEDTDYDEWEVSELKGELKERGLKADGRKSVLVARLKKDDASDEEPF